MTYPFQAVCFDGKSSSYNLLGEGYEITLMRGGKERSTLHFNLNDSDVINLRGQVLEIDEFNYCCEQVGLVLGQPDLDCINEVIQAMHQGMTPVDFVGQKLEDEGHRPSRGPRM